MPLTFDELCAKLKLIDEVSLMEVLQLTSEDIVDRFQDRVEYLADDLIEDFPDEVEDE